MLVLLRSVGQSVRVGAATLTVLSVKEGKVKLGFEAPKEVKIVRAELPERQKGDGDGVSGDC